MLFHCAWIRPGSKHQPCCLHSDTCFTQSLSSGRAPHAALSHHSPILPLGCDGPPSCQRGWSLENPTYPETLLKRLPLLPALNKSSLTSTPDCRRSPEGVVGISATQRGAQRQGYQGELWITRMVAPCKGLPRFPQRGLRSCCLLLPPTPQLCQLPRVFPVSGDAKTFVPSGQVQTPSWCSTKAGVSFWREEDKGRRNTHRE